MLTGAALGFIRAGRASDEVGNTRKPGAVMLGLLIGAAILGLIIAAMEREGFPGWAAMIVSVLAATIPAALINGLLPPGLFIVGLAVGALCSGLAISAMRGMSVKRASIAASIYLGIQTAITLVFWSIT